MKSYKITVSDHASDVINELKNRDGVKIVEVPTIMEALKLSKANGSGGNSNALKLTCLVTGAQKARRRDVLDKAIAENGTTEDEYRAHFISADAVRALKEGGELTLTDERNDEFWTKCLKFNSIAARRGNWKITNGELDRTGDSVEAPEAPSEEEYKDSYADVNESEAALA